MDVLISVVVNAAQIESVLFGSDGYDGAADHLRPGSVFVMCSTVAPDWSAELEERLAEKGVLYLDAPISGGAARAAAGELTMMTSGSTAAYAVADPVLEAMSSRVYRLGDHAGLGSQVKIVNQLLAGVHIAAAAEAMALGIQAGVPAEALYEVITHSAGNSWMFENRMAHVLAGDFTPLSAVDIFVKDLGIGARVRTAATVPAPARRNRACDVPPGIGLRSGSRGRQRGHQDLPGHRAAQAGRGRDMPIRLGCIADDFTGATDLANNLVRAGMRDGAD